MAVMNSELPIGIIKSNWLTPSGTVKLYRYGTATLIAPNMILTCLHNVIREDLYPTVNFCNRVTFVLKPKNSTISSRDKVYKSRKTDFIRHFSKKEIQSDFPKC